MGAYHGPFEATELAGGVFFPSEPLERRASLRATNWKRPRSRDFLVDTSVSDWELFPFDAALKTKGAAIDTESWATGDGVCDIEGRSKDGPGRPLCGHIGSPNRTLTSRTSPGWQPCDRALERKHYAVREDLAALDRQMSARGVSRQVKGSNEARWLRMLYTCRFRPVKQRSKVLEIGANIVSAPDSGRREKHGR